MKTGKLIWVIIGIAVVLIIVAYFVGRNNIKKTAAAIATAPVANPAVTGRLVASQSGAGARWIQVANVGNTCPEGSTFGSEIGMTGENATKCFIRVANAS